MKILIVLFCLATSLRAVSQEITDIAAKPSEIDQNGDPVTNVMDPDGMRQGNWFFLDTEGKDVVKKIYADNRCKGTFFKLNNEWIEAVDFSTGNSLRSELIGELNTQNVLLENDQQILIIFDRKGDFSYVALLGNWAEKSATAAKKVVVAFILEQTAQNDQLFSHLTYILI